MDYEKYELGTVSLLSGEKLDSAFLIYKTYGKLNKSKDNVVVLPTFYTGSHQRNEGFLVLAERSIQRNILLCRLTCLVMASLHHQAILQLLRMVLGFHTYHFGITLPVSISYLPNT